MAVSDQPITSYSDTTPHKTVITDLIDIISPKDAPMVKRFMRDPGYFRMVNWPSTILYWLEDELADMTGALGASCASNDTSITVTDGDLHHVGDVVMIDSEYLWVSATGATVLTVTRSYGTPAAASHASAAVITRVSNARVEGADVSLDRAISDKTTGTNYTQIFQDDIKISRTEQKVSQYGLADMYNYEVAKRLEEQVILLDKTFFHGQSVAGSASAGRGMGGFEAFVTTNTTSLSSAALEYKHLKDSIVQCWDAGGNPDTLVGGSWVCRKISDMFVDSVRTDRVETVGGVVITKLHTEFGDLDVIMDRWCPATKLYILESDYVGYLAFDPFFEEVLSQAGDYVRGQVVGEYTLVVKNQKAHALIGTISTSS